MIPFKNYINITSGANGNSAVTLPALVGLVFSDNPLIPAGAVTEYTASQLPAIGALYGTTSDIYKRAAFYFGYLSPAITAPQVLKVAPMITAPIDAYILGNTVAKTQAAFDAISNGGIDISVGSHVCNLTALNFTGLTLPACAALIQTAIRAVGGVFATAVVNFVPTTSQFNVDFVGTGTGIQVLTVTAGAGTDISVLIGWTTASGATLINSALAGNNLLASFNAAVNLDNNFGSFCTSLTAPVGFNDYVTTATANNALNNEYMLQINSTSTNYVMEQALMAGIGGVGLNYDANSQYPEMLPMAIQAATNYYTKNGVVNFMYKQIAGLTPSVTDGTTQQALDALQVNYYGETQVNGQNISFYQRGYLQGGATDAVDMGVYSNEAWLKGYMGAALISLQLSLNGISANTTGLGYILTTIRSVILDALRNGTISPGKQLNNTQQLFITQQTGDANAWIQVQNSGYWYTAAITSQVVNNITEYSAVYTIIYSKNDVVRTITGTHELI